MQEQRVKKNYQLVSILLKEIITDRFKQMARDEVLSKFLQNSIDPVLLIDHHLQSEKEALDLAELSLLKLVISDHLRALIAKSSRKIQERFQSLYGDQKGDNYLSEDILTARMLWISVRLEFYKIWLSLSEDCHSPNELGISAFRSLDQFGLWVGRIFETDRHLATLLAQSTPPFHRFLMTKQLDCERESAREVWNAFMASAFRKTPELSGN